MGDWRSLDAPARVSSILYTYTSVTYVCDFCHTFFVLKSISQRSILVHQPFTTHCNNITTSTVIRLEMPMQWLIHALSSQARSFGCTLLYFLHLKQNKASLAFNCDEVEEITAKKTFRILSKICVSVSDSWKNITRDKCQQINVTLCTLDNRKFGMNLIKLEITLCTIFLKKHIDKYR